MREESYLTVVQDRDWYSRDLPWGSSSLELCVEPARESVILRYAVVALFSKTQHPQLATGRHQWPKMEESEQETKQTHPPTTPTNPCFVLLSMANEMGLEGHCGFSLPVANHHYMNSHIPTLLLHIALGGGVSEGNCCY